MRQQDMHVRKTRQSGFVAIFSVIFFTLLALVITIGFIRIVNIEQQQAINNNLTARALSAAESGVEDAKRAIDFYSKLPAGSTERNEFRQALNSDDCTSIFGSGSVVAETIGLDTDGQVAGDQNLFYTCLTVNLDTPNYIKTLAKDENHVIPLRGNDSFDRVTLQWHLNSDESDENGDGIPNNFHPVGSLPTVGDFGSEGDQPPAYIRAQLIGVPRGQFNRQDLSDRSRTIFLAPFTSGGNAIDLQTGDPRGFNVNKSSPFQVSCQGGDDALGNTGGYACEVAFTMPGGALNTADNDYYLQVTPLYRDTRISARLSQGDTPRFFDAVQPSIDATGRAADVFRRVEVRVNFPGIQYSMPRYGIEVGDNICKQFQVTGDPSGFVNPAAALDRCSG